MTTNITGDWFGTTWAFVLGKDGSITTTKASLGAVSATSIKLFDEGTQKYMIAKISNGAWAIEEVIEDVKEKIEEIKEEEEEKKLEDFNNTPVSELIDESLRVKPREKKEPKQNKKATSNNNMQSLDF